MDRVSERVVVRSARLDDAAAISSLITELGYPAPPDVVATRLVALESARELVLVAELDGAVGGVLTVHVMPVLHRPTPVGRLSMLVVTERLRGSGIGRALVTAAEHDLASRGCALVEVTSNQKRKDAHVFYERLGYEVTSLRFKRDLGTALRDEMGVPS